MSLEGFIAGHNADVATPMGFGDEQLHAWMFDQRTEQDAAFVTEFKSAGVLIVGRRMFDLGEAPWGDLPPFHRPVFIVTHRGQNRIDKAGGTSYHFVTDGVESALRQARAAANGSHIYVARRAGITRASLKRGFLDELRIHLVPVLLGEGTDYSTNSTAVSFSCRRCELLTVAATHLVFRVAR